MFDRHSRSLFVSALTFFLCLLAPVLAHAQERIVVESGKGIFLPHIGEVETVFVADTTIADVTASPGEAVFLFGKSVGETTLIATDLNGKEAYNLNVSVVHNLDDLARSMQQRFDGESIRLHTTRGSVMITGTVSNERVKQDILATVQGSLPSVTVIDRLALATSNLIQLEVALYEVNRSRVEEYGINWRNLIGNLRSAQGIAMSLNLLVDNGVAAIVTETSMTTISGSTANFAVGGEVPIPTFASGEDGQGGGFSLDFKFIGMDLNFSPEQLSDDLLRLDITSTLSNAQGASASINGNSFPTLTSRSFDTVVELGDRQSFVIGGLSKSESFSSLTDDDPRNPFSSVARSIFSNDQESQQRQELIVVVTPKFKNLVGPSAAERLGRPTSNLEFILSGRGASEKGASQPARITGDAGFSY